MVTGIVLWIWMPLDARQEIPSRVDFTAVEKAISDPVSPFYYPVLLDRFLNHDARITIGEYRYLYYGFTFQNNYKPYDKCSSEDSVNVYLNRDTLSVKDLMKLHAFLIMNLNEKPVALKPLLMMASVCERLGESDSAGIWYQKYEKLLQAILTTGSGTSDTTAWQVIWVNDEYMILNALGFTYCGPQMLTPSRHNYLGVKENDLGVMGLYFDVSRMFSSAFKPIEPASPGAKKKHRK